MPDMPDLIEILESFNRKERFFLVAQALGNPKFELSTVFREKFAKAVDLEQGIEIPANAFAAMDYHLNWVHASLVLSHYSEESDRVSLLNLEGTTEDNQQDIDLLVAFKDESSRCHLIFVEAKGYDAKGFAGFGKGELVKKVKRLEKIINLDKESGHQGVETYFCLMSGYKPQNLTKNWPEWNGKPLLWMPLSLPDARRVVNYSDFSIVELSKGKGSKAFHKTTIVGGRS